jgi:hypothetical protein
MLHGLKGSVLNFLILMPNTHKFDLNFWEENPGKCSLWSAAYLLGMTDVVPLPRTRDDALYKHLINGHAKYLPDNSTVALDAFVDGKGEGNEVLSFWIPHDCMYVPYY